MIKVGLTGNIGSGKSMVAGIFEALGTPVYHADTEAKKILDEPEVISEIRSLFGEKVLSGSRVDRKALASIVFDDRVSLDRLNAVIHPRVREDLFRWIESQVGIAYVIQEAAILFESGFHTFFDKTILVSCPVDIAVERVMKRDQASEEEVRLRMKNQWPETKKSELADFIIVNDGQQLVIPQVITIHELLSQ